METNKETQEVIQTGVALGVASLLLHKLNGTTNCFCGRVNGHAGWVVCLTNEIDRTTNNANEPTIEGKTVMGESEGFDFGEALEYLRGGYCVAREGWNGKGMWIALRESDELMTLPYIYMCTAQKDFVPWLASQTDVLADDWMVVSSA